MTPRLVTAAELARALGVKPGTILDWWEAGKIPGYRLPGGRAVRFDCGEILELTRREARHLAAVTEGE